MCGQCKVEGDLFSHSKLKRKKIVKTVPKISDREWWETFPSSREQLGSCVVTSLAHFLRAPKSVPVAIVFIFDRLYRLNCINDHLPLIRSNFDLGHDVYIVEVDTEVSGEGITIS